MACHHELGIQMAAVCAQVVGVLDGMIDRGEAAIDRYRARLGGMQAETFSANRLRATIQVMQGRIDALRLSRDKQRTAHAATGTALPPSNRSAPVRH
jgi:hypothetical protein